MNQGKLEVVKQEMARVNIDILGLSDAKHRSSLDEDRNQAHAAQEVLRQMRSAMLSTEGRT